MSFYRASYYNRVVSHHDKSLLFNGATGALVRMETDITSSLLHLLGPKRSKTAGEGLDQWNPPSFQRGDLPPSAQPFFEDLVDGGFFVPEGFDEQQAIRRRVQRNKNSTSLYMRITTTLNCNYSCYYCFEDKSAVNLTQPGCDAIYDWVVTQLDQRGYNAIFTDWFGGEPMLNRQAIDYLSDRLIKLAELRRLHYESAITCNGSLWPADSLGFVRRSCITKVQFTLDGPPDHHRKRRRLKPDTNASEDTFDAVIKVVDSIKNDVNVILRINVDSGIGNSVLDLVPFFQERGWLSGPSRVFPYLGLIGPMNDHCSNLDSARFREFRTSFNEINREFRRRLASPDAPTIRPQLPPFPTPMKSPCSAVSNSSVIFGPDGRLYRCVLDVGHTAMAHDSLLPLQEANAGRRCSAKSLESFARPVVPHPYLDYDPVKSARCSHCQYLPVCLGGCPKDQMESNEFYIQERGMYWETNLDEMIRMHADRAEIGVPAA